jgi:L-rhamnose mutarotase
MPTYALHSVLRPGREGDYDREHATIWPELLQSLQDAGITNWHIWRSGLNLFHVVEADDLHASFARLDTDPVNQRWQEFINQIVDHFEAPNGEQILPLVWSLGHQSEAPAKQ